MHPILFHIGPFSVRAYGVALAVAFLVGCWLALRRARARELSEDVMIGLFWWIIISAMVGARLHFIVAHPQDFPRVTDAFRFWEGGLTLYGGLIAAMLASWIYLRRHRVGFLAVADVVAPSLALGEAITRIGCFVNGCCFGQPHHGALSVLYPPDSYAAYALGPGVEVWASQLLLMAALGAGFVILLLAERFVAAPGWTFGLFLVLQGIARWGVDHTRYYEAADRLTWGIPLLQTKSQLVALALLVVGVFLAARAVVTQRRALEAA